MSLAALVALAGDPQSLAVAVMVRLHSSLAALTALPAATEPTLTLDQLTTWWNQTPAWAKLSVAAVAGVLVVVGVVKRLVLLTLLASLLCLGLLGWWWWVNRGSVR